MPRLSLLAAVAVVMAAISPPLLAQESEGVIGPGSRCGLEPSAESICPADAEYGYEDVGVAAPDAMEGDSYCAARFRSYDPESGTYMGYDGRRHPCP